MEDDSGSGTQPGEILIADVAVRLAAAQGTKCLERCNRLITPVPYDLEDFLAVGNIGIGLDLPGKTVEVRTAYDFFDALEVNVVVLFDKQLAHGRRTVCGEPLVVLEVAFRRSVCHDAHAVDVHPEDVDGLVQFLESFGVSEVAEIDDSAVYPEENRDFRRFARMLGTADDRGHQQHCAERSYSTETEHELKLVNYLNFTLLSSKQIPVLVMPSWGLSTQSFTFARVVA